MRLSNFLLIGVLLVAAFILIELPVRAASNTATEFVQKASIGNQFEVETSKLALQKSGSAEVKKLAQMMIEDHGKAGEQLKTALKTSTVPASAASVTLDAKHQQTYDTLKNAGAGADFDRQYLKAQEDAHNEAIALFESYAKVGDDNPLKEFATRTLPTLQQHKLHVVHMESSFKS